MLTPCETRGDGLQGGIWWGMPAPQKPQVRGTLWDEDRAVGWSWKWEGCRESAVLRQERIVEGDECLEIGICSSWHLLIPVPDA